MARVSFKSSDTEFDPLPNGNYICEVDSMEVKKSSTGNLMISAAHSVIDPKVEGSRKLWENFSLQPQAGWKLKNFLEAAQVPHQAMPGAAKGEFEIDFDTQDAIKARFVAHFEQETYEKIKDGKFVLDDQGNKIVGIRNKVVGYLKV